MTRGPLWRGGPLLLAQIPQQRVIERCQSALAVDVITRDKRLR